MDPAAARRRRNGELENLVLECLWSIADWSTPGEVLERLPMDRPLAYNTVVTILTRLCEKGSVERTKRGRAFAYRTTSSREVRAAERMARILDAAGGSPTALAAFVDGLTADQLDGLRRALDRRGEAS